MVEHGLTMREGDRRDRRPGAHIIENQDGKLIGSFIRLTKVRVAEFRKLLAEEQQQTVSKPEMDIKSTHLPIRRTTADLYNEYPIPKASDTLPVLSKRHVTKRPQMNKWQTELWLKRMSEVNTPATEPHLPEPPLRIIRAEEARFHRKIRDAIALQQAILDQQAPETGWAALERDATLAKWHKQLTPYQRQLRDSFNRYHSAKQAWTRAQKSVWLRMNGKSRRLEKICDRLLLEFLEVLRFVVQTLLHIVGLRSTPATPLRSSVTENDRPALEAFRKRHDAEFSAMADQATLNVWLSSRFDRLVDARAQRIQQWNMVHQPEKDSARQEIKRLSTLLTRKPISSKRQVAIKQHPSSTPAFLPSCGSS